MNLLIEPWNYFTQFNVFDLNFDLVQFWVRIFDLYIELVKNIPKIFGTTFDLVKYWTPIIDLTFDLVQQVTFLQAYWYRSIMYFIFLNIPPRQSIFCVKYFTLLSVHKDETRLEYVFIITHYNTSTTCFLSAETLWYTEAAHWLKTRTICWQKTNQ